MKADFLFTLVLICIFNMSKMVLAQNEPSISDTLREPRVYIQDGFIGWKNFPVCAADDKTIILVHIDYSCCVSTPVELRCINAENNSLNQKILLIPAEDLPDFDNEKNLNIIAEVNKVLAKKEYFSMVQLDSFTINKSSSASKSYIDFEFKQLKFRTDDFKLPDLVQKGYCCSGIPDDKAKCKVYPNKIIAYISKDSKLLLIEYGYIHPADGCDIGPYYITVKLNKL